MNLFPVIERELRGSARHAFTYHLRAIGAAAALLASVLFGINHGFRPSMGGALFTSLHTALFCAIWIFVPLLTADCISKERREGTLGLLFLTRLQANDIVVAKSLAHGMRAVTLWLAVLPVVMIPILLGGVSWSEAGLSVMVNFTAMCWALAAGLLGSAWSKAWLRALLHAGVLAVVFFLVLGMTAGLLLLPNFTPGGWGGWQVSSDYVFVAGLAFVLNLTGGWSLLIRGTSTGQIAWAMGQVALFSWLVLVGAVLLAGRKTRRAWQEEPPSRRQLWWQRTFCTPVVGVSLFRRWMRWKLAHNPIGWLEQRTWSGRLVTWGWLAVLISLYSAALTDRTFFRDADRLQAFMAWLLAGSVGMSAAGSFRRERETGVLELLLVSPLGENQIISGRLRGLWGQFLPSCALLLGIWAYFTGFLPDAQSYGAILFFSVTFLILPVLGLYFSLCCRNFISAYLCTLIAGLLGPVLLSALLGCLGWFYDARSPFFSLDTRASIRAVVCEAVLGAFCWIHLCQRLRKRAFPLEKPEK